MKRGTVTRKISIFPVMPQNSSQPASTDQAHEVLTFGTKWSIDSDKPAGSSLCGTNQHIAQYLEHVQTHFQSMGMAGLSFFGSIIMALDMPRKVVAHSTKFW